MTPLERIAKKLYGQTVDGRYRIIGEGPPFAWEQLIPESKKQHLRDAHAVLQAIHEPSEGVVADMVERGFWPGDELPGLS